jgi:3-methyladenine DNA glycosylase AlkC
MKKKLLGFDDVMNRATVQHCLNYWKNEVDEIDREVLRNFNSSEQFAEWMAKAAKRNGFRMF